MTNQPTPEQRIKKIANDVQLITRQARYDPAKEKALAVAVRIQGQVDFVETLDICMRAAMDSADFDLCITVSRAVEMFSRLEHYLDCMGKYYAHVRETGASLEELDKETKSND